MYAPAPFISGGSRAECLYFYFIFITVKIPSIKLLFKIFINNLNVSFIQKHAFHFSNTAAFTITVFTNHFVLIVRFSVLTGFYETHCPHQDSQTFSQEPALQNS